MSLRNKSNATANDIIGIMATESTPVTDKTAASLPLANKNSRAFSRLFLAGATECETDKQGRILITAPLKAYASLIKDVVIIGNGNKVEIWSSENWDEYIFGIDTDEIADNLCDLGIMI